MLAGDDQFAALAVDMAQHGFGRRNAVQPDLAFGEVDVHGPNLLVHGRKIGPLDRLINLDYINQYEKFRGALPLRPGSFRRARDLAGHALRLCQPRPDPLRADAGFAQEPLPRRGRPRPEGTPRAVTGAARLAQF